MKMGADFLSADFYRLNGWEEGGGEEGGRVAKSIRFVPAN